MVLIIGGHLRSGTTLLRNLCNDHPDITVTNEFANFAGLGMSYKKYSYRLLKKRWQDRTRSFLASGSAGEQRNFVLQSHIFLGRYLFELIKHRNGYVNILAVETAMRNCLPITRIVGDKYPDYVFMLDKLSNVDGLVTIIIYRDCRDVVRSTLERVKTKWRKNAFIKYMDTAEKVAHRWVGAIESMEQHTDKIHSVRYEQLIMEPRKEFKKIGQCLGVDPSGFPAHLIRRDSIGKYHQELSEDQLAIIMKIAGPTMTRLGYS